MEKVFAGSGRTVKTKYGEMTKISFSRKDLETLMANLDNGWVNTILKAKKEVVEGKPSHYLEVDFYKPETKVANVTAKKLQEEILPDLKDYGDLPF